jgi:hypothetical protein
MGFFPGPNGDLLLSSAATSEVKRYDGTTGAFKSVFITAGLGGLNEAEGMDFGPNGTSSSQASWAMRCWSTATQGVEPVRGSSFRSM